MIRHILYFLINDSLSKKEIETFKDQFSHLRKKDIVYDFKT